MRFRERLTFGLRPNSALILWAMFFNSLAFGASDRFKPLYIEKLGAEPALIGVVLGLAEFIRLLCLIAAGPLGDRFPPRTMVRARWLALGTASTFLVAQRWWQLFPAFAFQAGANFAWPSVSSVIDQDGPEEARSHRFLMVYSIAPSVAILGAPVLGGLVADAFGLRATYGVMLGGLIAATYFFTKVHPPERTRRVTSGGYLAVLRQRQAAMLCALQGTTMFSAWLGLTLASNYLHNERGLSFGVLGILGTLVAVGSISAGLMITHVKRLGRRFNGTLVTTAFLPLFFVLMLLGNGAFVFALAYLSWGVASVTQQTYYGAIGDVTSANSRNRAFALLEVTYSVGIMVAGFAAGALYEWSPRYPLWVALAGSCIALAGAVLVRRRLIAGTPAAGVVAELVPAA